MPERVNGFPVRKTKTPEQALNYLMRYASKAERSGGDAMRLMRGWGISEEEGRKVLAKLKGMNFINDERFAKAYVHDKVKLGGWGIYKIRAGLNAKGIAPDIIAEALAGIETAGAGDMLASILERKARLIKSAETNELRTKLVRYGLSRGFEYDDVVEAAGKIAKRVKD